MILESVAALGDSMYRPLLAVLVIPVAGCGTSGPELSSLEPGLACVGVDPVEVTIHGEGFAPGLTGAWSDDPSGAMPRVVLVREGALDGTPDGATGHEVRIRAVRWADAGTLAFDLDASLGLSEGIWAAVVTNPDGGSARLAGALTLSTGPVVTDLVPSEVCQTASATPLHVEGTGFLVLETPPEVRVAGLLQPLAGTSGCAPLGGRAPGEVCTTLELVVDATLLAFGEASVDVRNPEPAACGSVQPAAVEVVPPPVVQAVEPDAMCNAGGSVRVSGEGFAETSRVFVGGVEAASVTWIADDTLEVVLHDGIPEGLQDVVVQNGEGCTGELADAIDVLTNPDIFLVDPAVLLSGEAVRARVYVADVSGEPSRLWLEHDATGEIRGLAFGWSHDDPGLVEVSLPADLDVGTWTLGLDTTVGCDTTLEAALEVTDALAIAVEGIFPAFAWTWDYTPVEILATDPPPHGMEGFEDVPRVYLSPALGEGTGTALAGTTFRSGARLTGVVPWGLEPGPYDLWVVNPDGTVGLLEEALEVTEEPPPRIDGVVPVSLSSAHDTEAVIRGRDFRAPTVTLECLQKGGVTALPVTVTEARFASISVLFPSSDFDPAVCTVRVDNADGPWARFASVSVRNPAQNLFPWSAGTAMGTPRRAPVALAGRTTSVARFLYALGGDDGSDDGALSTVERAAVDLYGDLGSWEPLPVDLPAPLTRAAGAVLERFLYVVGGHDGASATAGGWRALVLEPTEVPHLVDVSIARAHEGGLGAGTWAWRVSAVFPEDDPSNPGGESLACDALPVTLPEGDPLEVALGWVAVEGAAGYRVYRTPLPDAGTTDMGLVAVVTDGSLSWTDTGVPAGEDGPLPEGALGRWAALPDLPSARASPCVTVARDPLIDPEVAYLYVAGGRSPAGDALDEIVYLPITVVTEREHAAGAWTRPSVARLVEARWSCGAVTLDDTLHTVVGDESWIYVLGGEDEGGALGAFEAGRVARGGDLEAWQGLSDLTPAASGFGPAAAGDVLFVLGGIQGQPTTQGMSGEVTPGLFPDVRNWNNLGIALTQPRYLAGCAQESAVLFMVGGRTETAAATATTDATVY